MAVNFQRTKVWKIKGLCRLGQTLCWLKLEELFDIVSAFILGMDTELSCFFSEPEILTLITKGSLSIAPVD